MKEIKELIYKDALLFECLFNNIGFNLYDCATQEEIDDITKFRKLLERNLVENILKIVKQPIENEVESPVKEKLKSKKIKE